MEAAAIKNEYFIYALTIKNEMPNFVIFSLIRGVTLKIPRYIKSVCVPLSFEQV